MVATEAATQLGLSDHAPLILDFDVGPIAMEAWADKRPEASGSATE
jgi:hypothetical protein